MTSSVIRKYALAALCGAAIVGVGQSAQAANWDIFGGGAPASSASYGTLSGDNNVINNPSGASGVYDTLAGASVVAGAQLHAVFTTTYNVQWTYLGSESGNTIQFIAPGVAGFPAAGFAENNANNQCSLASCGSSASGVAGQTGNVNLGTAVGQTAVTPDFKFLDSDLSNATNGTNPFDNVGQPNFLISYAVLLAAGDPGATFGAGLYLTASVSDWVVMGFNDTGAPDDNHDDHMIAAFISAPPGEQETPIPGALPLFASVLGGGYLFRRLRNRRQAQAKAAA